MTCYFCHKEINQKDPWGTVIKNNCYEYFHTECQHEYGIKKEAQQIADSIDKFLEEEYTE